MHHHKKIASSFKRYSFAYSVAAAVLILLAIGTSYYHHADTSGSSWCLPFETLDWQGGYCYATCGDSESCAALDENYKTAHDTMSDDDRRWYYFFSTMPMEVPEGGFAPSTASVYTIHNVEDGVLGNIIDASSTPKYRGYSERTWNLISLVLPHVAAKHITEFAGYSDIAGGTGAFVMPMDDTMSTWSINVNYAGFYTPQNTLYDRGNSIHTLIHEIGHVITLADAFDPDTYTIDFEGNPVESTEKCYTTQFVEGCARVGSFLAIFAARFWPEAKGNGDVSGVYGPEKFVSAYAATNIAEDVAETWAAFVLLDKPTGSTLADRKVRFFYQYPEFVAARTEILKNIHRLH